MRWAVAGVGVMVALLVVLWWRADDGPAHVASAAPADAMRTAPPSPLAAAAPPPTGELRLAGTVVDEHDAPVEGARIELAGFAVDETTDAAGAFAIDNVAARHYRIAARAADASGSAEVDLTATSAPVVLALQPLAIATLHVVDDSDGHPLAGATIAREGHDDGVTDAQGVFELHGLPAGAGLYLDVEAIGYESQAATLEVDDDPHRRNALEVRMRHGAAVGGTVVDGNDAPVPEATVAIATAAGAIPHRVTTNAVGHWHVAALAAGARKFTATSSRHIATEPLIVPLDGIHPREDLVIRVALGGRVTGRVVDESGSAVADATVTVEERDGGQRTTQSDATGLFALAGLDPGKHLVSATAGPSASVRQPAELVAGHDTDVRLVVAPSSISGVVVDSHNAPVVGARVRGYRDDVGAYSPLPDATSDAAGKFELAGVTAGRYRVSAARPGQTYVDGHARATVAAGTHDVRLVVSEAGSVTGRVVRDGKPVRSYAIELTRTAGEPWSSYPRDIHAETGRFTEEDVPAGTWRVTIAGPGFARTTRDNVAIVAGGHVDLGDIVVARGRAIRGRVIDATGSPVAGATVSLHDQGVAPSSGRRSMAVRGTWVAVTDETGAFELDDVPAHGDRLAIRASHPTRGAVADREVAADETDLGLALVPYGGIDGVITGDASRVAYVWIYPGGSDAEILGDAFHFSNLRPGTYRLTGYPLPLELGGIVVAAGQRTSVTLTLPPAGIAVTLHTPGGCREIWLAATRYSDACFAGEATLPYVEPGSYRACIDRPDACLPITVAPSPPQQTIELP